jgi:hypothetical protein
LLSLMERLVVIRKGSPARARLSMDFAANHKLEDG